METTINERFSQLINALRMNPSAFAKSVNKSYTAIENTLKGKTRPGFDLLEAVFFTYPEVNTDWLIGGKGDMFRLSQKSADGGAFGDAVITDLAKNLEDIRQVFEDELRAKNHQIEAKDNQIASLQEMLKMALVGKSNDVAAGRSVVRIHPATLQLLGPVAATV